MRMTNAVLNKSWKQQLIKQQLYSSLPPTSQTLQDMLGTTWDIKMNSESTFSYGLLNIDMPLLDDKQELNYIISVQTLDDV